MQNANRLLPRRIARQRLLRRAFWRGHQEAQRDGYGFGAVSNPRPVASCA